MKVDNASPAGLILVLLLITACGSASPFRPTADAAVMPATIRTTAPSREAYQANFPTAVSALESFLRAEVDGVFDRSFELLSTIDQEAAGGVGGWAAEHFMVMPTIRDYRIIDDVARSILEGTAAAEGLSGVEATVELSLEPGLDQLVGLTTSAATSAWILVEEPAGWRVALTQSSIHPVYLDDNRAPTDVELWVAQSQSCSPPIQWDQALLGFPTLADTLCGTNGPVEVGEVQPLTDAAESAPFLAAFGPEVGLWARVVAVDSPAPLRAVVAPIGDRWLVIGVLEASSA